MNKETTENRELQNKYITVEQAKELCIEAHKGQWRKDLLNLNLEENSEADTLSTEDVEDGTIKVLSTGTSIEYNGYGSCWYGKQPYSSHPIAVAEMMNTDEERIVAYLHDVFEDCSEKGYRTNQQGSKYYIETPDKIYPIRANVYFSLNCLTRRDDETYTDYLEGVASRSLSVKVKIADMFHNMSDNPSERQKTKYTKGLKLLLGAL